MRNYEALRETPAYRRDIYSELKRIEERGKRKKNNRKPLLSFFRADRAPRSV